MLPCSISSRRSACTPRDARSRLATKSVARSPAPATRRARSPSPSVRRRPSRTIRARRARRAVRARRHPRRSRLALDQHDGQVGRQHPSHDRRGRVRKERKLEHASACVRVDPLGRGTTHLEQLRGRARECRTHRTAWRETRRGRAAVRAPRRRPRVPRAATGAARRGARARAARRAHARRVAPAAAPARGRRASASAAVREGSRRRGYRARARARYGASPSRWSLHRRRERLPCQITRASEEGPSAAPRRSDVTSSITGATPPHTPRTTTAVRFCTSLKSELSRQLEAGGRNSPHPNAGSPSLTNRRPLPPGPCARSQGSGEVGSRATAAFRISKARSARRNAWNRCMRRWRKHGCSCDRTGASVSTARVGRRATRAGSSVLRRPGARTGWRAILETETQPSDERHDEPTAIMTNPPLRTT